MARTPSRSAAASDAPLGLVDYNSCVLYRSCLAIILMAFCAGCGIEVREVAGIPTFQAITVTLPAFATSHVLLSETPLPPLATQSAPVAMVTPVEGLTTTQINVRAEPSTASEVLGILPVNAVVQIVGKDPGENWWQILYPDAGEANNGKGWVTAQYVSTAEQPQVPVVGGGQLDPANPNAPLAVIQEQLNVRSGPGISFNSLGTLNPQDVVTLTGKDSNGAWLQIEFSAGPDGRGWINAAFAQAHGIEELPIVGESGQVIGTGTPVDTPLPPTPTVVPAPSDNDSAQAPAVNVTFTPHGTHALQFTSDVSSPTGDSDDWIQFTPFTTSVILELTCTDNGWLTVELLQSDQSVQNWGNIACGARQAITTQAGTAYQVHIQATAGQQLQYTRFTLRIVSTP